MSSCSRKGQTTAPTLKLEDPVIEDSIIEFPIIGTTETHTYALDDFKEIFEYICESLGLKLLNETPYKIHYTTSFTPEYIYEKFKTKFNIIKTQSSTNIQLLQFQKLLSGSTPSLEKNEVYITIDNARFHIASIVEEDSDDDSDDYSDDFESEENKSAENKSAEDDWYFIRSTLFCSFIKDTSNTHLIKSYTSDSSILNINTIIAFTTNNVKFLKNKYTQKYDVAYFNSEMLDMFLLWFNSQPAPTIKQKKTAGLDISRNPILFSGGSLLCDRLGIPISSKLDKSIYLMTCLSISTSEEIASNFKKNCMYQITIPEELVQYLMPLEKCTTCKGEYEVLLPVGSSLKVTSITPRYVSNRTKYEISMTLENYNVESLENLKMFFKSASNYKKVLKKGGIGIEDTQSTADESCKNNTCGFFTQEDIDSINTIMDISKIPSEEDFNKVKDVDEALLKKLKKIQDIGNYICTRLQTKCDDKQYANKTVSIKNIVKCVKDDCDILPYIRYNLNIPDYIDSDIGYINVGDIEGLENEKLAYITFGKKVKERFNFEDTDLADLDTKMLQFFNNDNKFKMKKYIHWKLYSLYHASTTDEFTKSIIRNVKQHIVYNKT